MKDQNNAEIYNDGDSEVKKIWQSNGDSAIQIVVKLNNVYYSYGKENVLNGITMSIPKGRIYGLLGSSGCGKTTSLRLLIGILKPSSGRVLVFGNDPGRGSSSIPGSGVGFMPQDMALSSLFTIDESMIYYSKLNQMKSSVANERMRRLSKLLKLPDGVSSVSTLSAGQKRRVSLAIALIHSPPLLILDEPTVGVDSLLREVIWNHLKEICAENDQTIIITTHYIEEAKAANCIGLMRYGKLLIEDDPQMIIEKTNESSFENAFLKLSHEQQMDESKVKMNHNNNCITEESSNSLAKYDIKENECSNIIKSKRSDKTKAVVSALLWKNMILFKKNYIFLSFYMTVLPFIMVAYFGSFIGVNPKYISMGVFNEDSPPLTSKMIINNIDPTVLTLIDFDNLNDAIESVKNYKTNGVIIFAKNYTQSIQIAMFECDYSSDKTDYGKPHDFNRSINENDNTINSELRNDKLMTQIDLLMDSTDQILVRTVLKELYNTFKRVNEKTKTLLKSITEIPIESPINMIDPPIYGRKFTNIRDLFVPATVYATIFSFSLSMSGLLILIERSDRVIERSYSCGLKTHHLMFSHIITQTIINAIQIISSQLSVYLVFGYESEGSIILVFLLYLIQGVFGICLSHFICSISSNEINAVLVIIGIYLPLLSISGAFIYPEQFSRPVKYALKLSPTFLNFIALREVYQKGWGLSSGSVQLGFISTIFWIIPIVLVTFYFLNKKIHL